MKKLKQERDKLFPGSIKWVDLKNKRYISRKPIYDFLIENSDKITGKVLDFGCGSMQYKTIMKFADEYIGLDIQGAEENGFFADDVIYYDGKHIPFEDASFDSVFAIEVFEHVEDIEYVLSEIHRILKKGGVFMFTVPMTFPLHLEPWDYRRFTKYGIKKYLKSSDAVI